MSDCQEENHSKRCNKMLLSHCDEDVNEERKFKVLCCGRNYYGQLSISNNNNNNTKWISTVEETAKNILKEIKQIELGASHSMILTFGNELWVCGWNYSGQLGLGHNESVLEFVQVMGVQSLAIKAIASKSYHSALLTCDNQIYCCGDNEFGQLGIDQLIECNTFHPTNANHCCEEIILLKCGLHKTGFLTRSGKLYLAGNNQNGQLGLQNVSIAASFTYIDYIKDPVKDFGFGHSHTVILTNRNTIYSCGENTFGQLGFPDGIQRNIFTPVNINIGWIGMISVGASHVLLLTNANELYSFGNNMYGQLGVSKCTELTSGYLNRIEFKEKIKFIKCGNFRSILITDRNEFYFSGRNDFGQLSLGDRVNRFGFCKIPLPDIKEAEGINEVSLGDCFTFFYHRKDEMGEISRYLCRLKSVIFSGKWSDVTIIIGNE